MPVQQLCLMLPVPILVVLASVIPICIFYTIRVLHIHRQRMSKLHGCIGCVPATVTHITIDATNWREGWIVAATWVDAYTRRTYTFHSSPQELHPRKRIGERVLVFISSNNPMHYVMEL